jgi:hypothetical protein
MTAAAANPSWPPKPQPSKRERSPNLSLNFAFGKGPRDWRTSQVNWNLGSANISTQTEAAGGIKIRSDRAESLADWPWRWSLWGGNARAGQQLLFSHLAFPLEMDGLWGILYIMLSWLPIPRAEEKIWFQVTHFVIHWLWKCNKVFLPKDKSGTSLQCFQPKLEVAQERIFTYKRFWEIHEEGFWMYSSSNMFEIACPCLAILGLGILDMSTAFFRPREAHRFATAVCKNVCEHAKNRSRTLFAIAYFFRIGPFL